MFEMFDDKTDKDLLSDRVFDLGNNKLHLKKEDPYGLWYIHFEKGQIPAHLKGAYTSFWEGEKAVKVYLADKSREVKAVIK